MAEVKWIKIVTNIFDDEKICYIETLPSGDEMIVIWFKILCLAGRSNSSGLLMMTDRIAYTDQMLSSIFSKDIKTIQLALSVFQNLEMIEMIDNRIYLLNWEKHQNAEKLEKIREQTRLRVSEHRQKQIADSRHNDNSVTEALQDRYSNNDVTQQNKNKNKEEDKDKEKNTLTSVASVIKPPIKSLTSVINEYTTNDGLRETLKDYKDMRLKMSKGFSTNAMKLILNKLSKLSSDDSEKIAIVNQSIENTWKGIFELKTDLPKKNFNNYGRKEIETEEDQLAKQRELVERLTSGNY